MHGDRVVVRVERQRGRTAPKGRIVRILERANATIVGRFDVDDAAWGSSCRSTGGCSTDVQVPRGEHARRRAGRDGDRRDHALADADARPPLGRIIEVLGADRRAGRRHARSSSASTRIPDAHGDEAIAEARRLGTAVRPQDIEGRTDFRTVPTVTIDGEHARDFDDAITLERLPNGHYWLGVHIADVSHYVEEGSALDAEAYERGHVGVLSRSARCTCFRRSSPPGCAACNPHVDRLVQSCLMEVDRQRRRRARRVARRRHPQRRADDLHRRQRDPDRARCRDARSATSRSCRCSS